MKKVIYIWLLLPIAWLIWVYTASFSYEKPSDTFDFIYTKTIVLDTLNKGNIIAIQPEMFPEDYKSGDHFYKKIDGYLSEGLNQGFFKENTLVLLPEYVATWLVINNERKSVASSSSMNAAMARMIMMQPFKILRALKNHQGEADKMAASIFRMKAESMAKIYGDVFKDLAKKYNANIVAGSIVLPASNIVNNEIIIEQDAPLYNMAFLFHKDGTIDKSIVKKVFPITSEQAFLASGNLEDLPVYNTKTGNVGVLVCADSWYPSAYEKLKAHEVEIVLVNSFCAGNNSMSDPWQGYDGYDNPADINLNDISNITEEDAWIKYALPGRIGSSGAILGINVFLSGDIWELGSDGYPFFMYKNKLIKGAESHGIWNLEF